MADLYSFLNPFTEREFLHRFGDVFEHSPWVAEFAFEYRPFASIQELHRTMYEVVRGAPEVRQMALLRAHPDLGARLDGLTDASKAEQTGAGLAALSEQERRELLDLNGRYRDRFDFPFILAVRGKSKDDVLAALRTRSNNRIADERYRAMDEVVRIAEMRLADKLEAWQRG